MTRNDDYWGPKAAIKEIVLRKVGEDAARLAGLLAGQGTSSTMSPSKRSPV